MIDRTHDMPLVRQARALGISRSSVYYLPRAVPAADLALIRAIDELIISPLLGGTMVIAMFSLAVAAAGAVAFGTVEAGALLGFFAWAALWFGRRALIDG